MIGKRALHERLARIANLNFDSFAQHGADRIDQFLVCPSLLDADGPGHHRPQRLGHCFRRGLGAAGDDGVNFSRQRIRFLAQPRLGGQQIGL